MIGAGWRIRIERSAEEVFDFVADVHNEPRFNPDASNIVRKTDGEIGLGTCTKRTSSASVITS